MKRTILLLITLFTASFAANAQQEQLSSLTVNVTGIEKQEGNILLAIYNSEDTFLGKPIMNKKVSVEGETVVLEIAGLADGTYAFSLFHDENSNGKLDKGNFGIPSEPYAFSNNAKGYFGPASFEDSSFKLESKALTQTIKLK